MNECSQCGLIFGGVPTKNDLCNRCSYRAETKRLREAEITLAKAVAFAEEHARERPQERII